MTHHGSKISVPRSGLAIVARQPIFDTRLEVVAHELLYRSASGESTAVMDVSAATATARVIVDACLEIGLDRLVGPVPAHINFPAELLVADSLLPVPARRIVVEVLEDVRAEPMVKQALGTLRARGHLVALDDFVFGTSDEELLDFADIVKVDVRSVRDAQLAQTCRALRGRGLRLIAEKVETLEEFECCARLGFAGFQGYFLRRPENVTAPRLPSNFPAMLDILAELQTQAVDVATLERLVAHDPATSYRILRCINSSYYNFPKKISSLRQAIVILGLDELRRLCTVAILGSLEARPVQLLIDTLVRARMCELLGALTGVSDPGEYFVTGLLSLFNCLLGVPMEEALEALPLSPQIVRALTMHEGSLGAALRCVQNYESGRWAAVHYGDLSMHEIGDAYLEAVCWADVSGSWLRTERSSVEHRIPAR